MPIGTRIEIDYNKVIMSSTGPFKIIRELDPIYMGSDGRTLRRMVEVEFIETGTRKQTQLQSALKGSVADPYYKSIAGVGYLGDIAGEPYDKKAYDMWRNMIIRCYDPSNNDYYHYGALGIKVDERWHNFTNFYYDLPALQGYYGYFNANPEEKRNYSIDKDLLQSSLPMNQRVYSKRTCALVPLSYNSRCTSRNLDKPNTTSQYFGVYKTATGSFQASVNIDGKKYFLGTYSNELAAATMYNYVISNCGIGGAVYNEIPYMNINDALSYRTSRTPLVLPPNIRDSRLNLTPNTSSNYTGVTKRGNSYMASYFCNGQSFHIGSFTNEIAAANAYNYYNQYYANMAGHVNNIQYMQPSEWLQYKTYVRGKKPVIMCKIIDK